MRSRNSRLIVVLVLFALIVTGLLLLRRSGKSLPKSPPTSPNPTNVHFGDRTKTSGCQAVGLLPDPDCSPGEIINVSNATICTPGYAKRARKTLNPVTSRIKRQVYLEYGIKSYKRGQYEVDHIVSLELGGSNSIANLWPEPALPLPGFHQKDRVEDILHFKVCRGEISLHDAQVLIATDWISVYKTLGPSRSSRSTARTA